MPRQKSHFFRRMPTRRYYSQEGIIGFTCHNCNLTSLKGIHKIIEEINDSIYLPDSVESNILGLLKIRNLQQVAFIKKDGGLSIYKREISDIINNYLPNPSASEIIDCQNELIDAGFEEYAEL